MSINKDNIMISNQIVAEILRDWSFWEAAPNLTLTQKREVVLPETLHPDLALVIQGVRRGGKSTLLTQFPKHYHLAPNQFYYFNF